MKKNEDIELYIDDLGTDGQGIGKHEGMAVFLPGALPGETVCAKIIAIKKSFAVGKLLEIKEPSPAREKPPCNSFSKCGGCTLQHLSYTAQLEYKQNRVKSCIERIAKLDAPVSFPLPSAKNLRYRNKAAFPIKLQNGQVNIGLYAAHSHNVVDIDDCKIQHPDLAIALSQLRVWIIKYEVSIYDEQTQKGLLRHAMFRSNSAGELMMILVINGDDVPNKPELLALFRFVLPQVKSIVLNHNQQDTNVIMGEKNTVIFGRDHFFETLCGLEFKIGPSSFLQVNTPQAQTLYKNLMKSLDVKDSDTALDLYCGAGMITLLLAGHAKKAYGVEISQEAVENARFNAKLNDIENAEFFTGDVLEILPSVIERAGKIDIVAVDPPRKGLSESLINAIAELSPRCVGYVSCDPATLSRDLALFDKLGYKAGEIQPVDLFPQTTHVETICLLSKLK